MNVDTDTQWAYWEGIKDFYKKKSGYLQGQIGNPEGNDKPNKSYTNDASLHLSPQIPVSLSWNEPWN